VQGEYLAAGPQLQFTCAQQLVARCRSAEIRPHHTAQADKHIAEGPALAHRLADRLTHGARGLACRACAQHRPMAALVLPAKKYRGVLFDPTADVHLLKVIIPTRAKDRPPATQLASYPGTPEGAQACARAADCIFLLLHGPYATTNFPWASYTQAGLRAAAEQLRGAGCDVRAAVAAAQSWPRRACTWARVRPVACPGQWVATANWHLLTAKEAQRVPGDQFSLKLDVGGPFGDPDAAARMADAALLVMEGPRRVLHKLQTDLNFPAASISEGDMRAAHQALQAWVDHEAVFSGVYREHKAKLLERFEKNVTAFNEVGPHIKPLPPHSQCTLRHAPQAPPITQPIAIHLPCPLDPDVHVGASKVYARSAS
jgi:hypothetical protein